jgi:hypothetical protein
MNVNVNTRLLIRILAISLLLLVILNLFVVFLMFSRKYHNVIFYEVFHQFYFDNKNNLPSFFNTLLLLLASALLYHIYLAHSGKFFKETKWLVASGLLLFMAIEENASIHVFLSGFMPAYSPMTMLVWVAPLGVFLIGLSVYFGKLAMRLPRRIAIGFLVSGVIYMSGAVLLDQTGSGIASAAGERNLTYVGISTLEETLEMTGIIIFIHYLLEYIKTELDPVAFRLS